MPYFGVEITETGAGTAQVSEQTAATCFLVGTAPVGDVHATAEERAPYINNSVLITSEEDAIAAFGEPTAGYTIPAALKAMFAKAGTKGIGTIEVHNVFDPDTHATVADVTPADVIGGFDAAGTPTGLYAAYGSYQRFGRFNKFLAAPGFTLSTGVRAALETIANRTRARAPIDAPFGSTWQQAIEARGVAGPFDWNFASRRLIPLWPGMEVADAETNGTRLDPYSPHFLGVWLSSILEYGYHYSPSNRPLSGIEELEVPVTYIPGVANSDPQLLRAAGIVTAEARYGKGPHTSGNRSAAYPTDTDMRNFLHVQLIEDVLDESVIHYLDQFKDRTGSPARIETMEEGINAFLRSQMTGDDPAISDGHFRFDRTRTTAATVAQGQFYWSLQYAPTGVMEDIIVDRNIDLALITDALGLAA